MRYYAGLKNEVGVITEFATCLTEGERDQIVMEFPEYQPLTRAEIIYRCEK